MLKNLKIQNFRALKELTFENFAQVNLLVGRNNVGKSSVLEALRIYASYADPREIERILGEHNEALDIIRNGDNEVALPIEHLFTGHQILDIENDEIYIGDLQDLASVRMKRVYFTLEKIEAKEKKQLQKFIGRSFDNAMKRKELGSDLSKIPNSLVTGIRQILKVTCKSDLLAKLPMQNKNGSLDFWFDFESYDKSEYEMHSRFKRDGAVSSLAFVPTDRLTDDVLDDMWEGAEMNSLQQEVIKALQIIRPAVENIFFRKRKDLPKQLRSPVVKLTDEPTPFPLKSMGDGMTRILQLILSMIKAKDGFLLIDEFENGLHYAVQPKVWELIFELAQNLNVQVFATTHSWDCVKSFRTAWRKNENKGSFHRISFDKNSANVYAMPYDCETLDTAVEEDIEVR